MSRGDVGYLRKISLPVQLRIRGHIGKQSIQDWSPPAACMHFPQLLGAPGGGGKKQAATQLPATIRHLDSHAAQF